MKAVAFAAPGKMELRELVEPRAAAGQVVLKVSHCGICGSDLHEFASQLRSLRLAGVFQPVMGHEFTGVVREVGEGVHSPSPGDAVVVHPGESCGNCLYCKSGRTQLCADQQGTGYRTQGAYAEFVAVRADQALCLPDGSWLERAALTEPLAVVLHAVSRSGLQPGESVLIAGAGPIGLLCLLAARRREAGLLIVSELVEARRELALRLGADQAVDPAKGPAFLQVQPLTEGLGADLAIEAVGIGPTMNDCLTSTR